MYVLLGLNLICPFVMLLVGYILKKRPVKDMSSHNGYDTPTSRRSQEHWDYAQLIAPDIFIRTGTVLFIVEMMLSVVLYVLKVSVVCSVLLGIVIGFAFLFCGFFRTEQKIKKHFSVH